MQNLGIDYKTQTLYNYWYLVPRLFLLILIDVSLTLKVLFTLVVRYTLPKVKQYAWVLNAVTRFTTLISCYHTCVDILNVTYYRVTNVFFFPRVNKHFCSIHSGYLYPKYLKLIYQSYIFYILYIYILHMYVLVDLTVKLNQAEIFQLYNSKSKCGYISLISFSQFLNFI